jgi:hypothetical protein
MIQEIENEPELPYAGALVKLLQGVVYSDEEKYWGTIILHQVNIARYFIQMNIELVLNEQEGFTFLRQKISDTEEKESSVPRLIRKRGLTYEQTLLCVMLREWVEEFDARTTESGKLFVTQKDIRERVEVFFKDPTNKSRLQKQLNACIEQAANSLGLLKKNREDEMDSENTQYEVKRIVKAMISNEVLEEIKSKLNQHISNNGETS